MKIYSSILTIRDLHDALPSDVSMSVEWIINPRKRQNGWVIHLEGHAPRHIHWTNSGTRGADVYRKAATYDDHGRWMALLFDKDPDAVISHWKSKEDFDCGTKGAYSTVVA